MVHCPSTRCGRNAFASNDRFRWAGKDARRSQWQRQRQATGPVITSLLLVIGLFVVGALGLMAFEISRYALAKDQLRTCVDASALAGSATLALYNDPADAGKAQMSAMKTALNLFQKNSVLGYPLSSAAQAGALPLKPGPAQSQLFFEFLNPDDLKPVAIGDPTGKVMRVRGAFGVVPSFGNFLSIGSYPVWNTSMSGVPMIDIINCFDIGGSMDDQTNVTFVKRYWSPPGDPAGKIQYDKVISPTTGLAEGILKTILNAPPQGINVNALPPQGLENTKAGIAPAPLNFSEANPATRGLRGAQNTGAPPGNYPGAVTPTPGTGGPDTFTDLVVNLDDQTKFGSFSKNGFDFPNFKVLVEAARGNLEDQNTFNNAHLNQTDLGGISPKAGYKDAYEQLACDVLHPMSLARAAALDFNYDIRKSADAEIGIVSFNDSVGKSDLDTFAEQRIASVYPQAATSNYLISNAYPRKVDDQLFSQYRAICTGPTARCYGGNNVAVGVDTAVNWLTSSNHRIAADRAIVVFSNSFPSFAQSAAAREIAANANSLGIPIYVVALSQDPATTVAQQAVFNDSNSNASSGGMAGIAGHGGRLFQITTQTNVRAAFGNVVRQLVKLVK